MENSTVKQQMQQSGQSPATVHLAAGLIAQWHQAGKLDFATAVKGKTLAQYKRESLPDTVAIVQGYLFKICDAFKVAANLSEYECAKIANKIISSHWTLKLAELPLFVDLVISGRLVDEKGQRFQVFGRIDEATIYDMLRCYELWAAEQRELLHAADKDKFSSALSQAHPKVLEALKTANQNAEIKQSESKIKKSTETKEQKDRIGKLSKLQKWFPEHYYRIIEEGRQQGEFTTVMMLEREDVKELLAKIENFTV